MDDLETKVLGAIGDTAKLVKDLRERTDTELGKSREKVLELCDRVVDLERKASDGSRVLPPGMDDGGGDAPSTVLLKSEAFKKIVSGELPSTKIMMPASFFTKTAIVNATGSGQPLVAAERVRGIVTPVPRKLTIRDLLPVGKTSTNLVEFTRENSYTNNAAPQYGSPDRENVNKPESAITFTLDDAAVVTLAHYIPVSKQVLADSPMLASYLNDRLMYGLLLAEEDQILNGDGSQGNMSGLLDDGNFTPYSGAATGDNKLDALRRAIFQLHDSEHRPTGIVLHPADWRDIDLLKNEQNDYLLQNPANYSQPSLWGVPVVITKSIDEGTFLIGDFGLAAQIWDREQASLELSRHDGDNFKKNMVTVLCEERLALAVYRPAALVSGAF